MKRKRLVIRSLILLVMFSAIGYTFYTNFSAEYGVVNAGDEARNFILEDLSGNFMELKDLQGKGVYVTFWATHCNYCRKKMEYLRDNYEDFKKQGVEVLAININESRVQVERHQQRYEINYPILLDVNNLVTDAYGVVQIPATFLIDENGRVIEKLIGGKTERQVIQSLTKLIPKS